jgi:hypothetical protein
MADITKCLGNTCKIKETCYRYTAPASTHWQSYMQVFQEVNKPEDCDSYWDVQERENG